MPGCGKPVAGVVADTADHDCRLSDRSRHLPARRLHEPRDRDAEALGSERVDLSDL